MPNPNKTMPLALIAAKTNQNIPTAGLPVCGTLSTEDVCVVGTSDTSGVFAVSDVFDESDMPGVSDICGISGTTGMSGSVGSVTPTAGISTAGFANPHTVHTSCFSPGIVSVAS